MKFVYNDGGRKAAGYTGKKLGDCVTRAVVIATGLPYLTVFDALSHGCLKERRTKGQTRKVNAAHGVHTGRVWFKRYMESLGWKWTPTMGIGTGCRVHLRDGELPMGRLVVSVSRHMVAVIDGVIHDTHDCSRNGKRCVYGYWHQ
jgi:hypothetical protein